MQDMNACTSTMQQSSWQSSSISQEDTTQGSLPNAKVSACSVKAWHALQANRMVYI